LFQYDNLQIILNIKWHIQQTCTHKHKSILQDTLATKDSSHYKIADRYELTIDETSDSSPIVH